MGKVWRYTRDGFALSLLILAGLMLAIYASAIITREHDLRAFVDECVAAGQFTRARCEEIAAWTR